MIGSLFHLYWITGPSGAKMEEHVFLTRGPVNESEYEATVSEPSTSPHTHCRVFSFFGENVSWVTGLACDRPHLAFSLMAYYIFSPVLLETVAIFWSPHAAT